MPPLSPPSHEVQLLLGSVHTHSCPSSHHPSAVPLFPFTDKLVYLLSPSCTCPRCHPTLSHLGHNAHWVSKPNCELALGAPWTWTETRAKQVVYSGCKLKEAFILGVVQASGWGLEFVSPQIFFPGSVNAMVSSSQGPRSTGRPPPIWGHSLDSSLTPDKSCLLSCTPKSLPSDLCSPPQPPCLWPQGHSPTSSLQHSTGDICTPGPAPPVLPTLHGFP